MHEFDVEGKKIRWAAKVAQVKEVILTGFADLDPIVKKLLPYGLTPRVSDGRAEVWIIVGDLKWKGMRFQELATTILVDVPDTRIKQEPAFLLRAYNTRRFFAWSERVFFKTPYYHGDVHITPDWPLDVSVKLDDQEVFRASAKGERKATSQGFERDTESVVFLPSGSSAKPKLFYSALLGEGQVWPWDADHDSLHLKSGDLAPEFELLERANFQPSEWSARLGAIHQKSKTATLTRNNS